MKITRKDGGITLIALVLTIIVLLILAGVSIATLTGPNGLLTRANQAKVETEKAEEKECVELALATVQIGDNGYKELKQLNLQNAIDSQFGINKAIVTDNGDATFTVSFIDSKRDYNITSDGVENGIDWNKAMQNAKAPESQDDERNNGVIGIGTDGNPVDMDLWEFTYISTNDSYALNDVDVINNDSIENKGYLGTFNEQGEIQSAVPMYIKSNTDKYFKPVTDMNNTFRECKELKRTPNIPRTVISMFTTFNSCINLEEPPVLPPNLLNMYGLFYNCKSLKYSPSIPVTVTNMAQCFVFCEKIQEVSTIPVGVTTLRGTFGHCKALKIAPNIPSTVVDMKETFVGCTNLKTPPVLIPESVDNLNKTFMNCSMLEGKLSINANPSIYDNCFYDSAINSNGIIITGNSHLLEQIINTKSVDSNIKQE